MWKGRTTIPVPNAHDCRSLAFAIARRHKKSHELRPLRWWDYSDLVRQPLNARTWTILGVLLVLLGGTLTLPVRKRGPVVLMTLTVVLFATVFATNLRDPFAEDVPVLWLLRLTACASAVLAALALLLAPGREGAAVQRK